mgnify:CR=1 FL=1
MDLLETYRENFSSEYEHNKAKVMEFTDVKSKKLRNIIAGYITRMVKAEAK